MPFQSRFEFPDSIKQPEPPQWWNQRVLQGHEDAAQKWAEGVTLPDLGPQGTRRVYDPNDFMGMLERAPTTATDERYQGDSTHPKWWQKMRDAFGVNPP